MDWTKRHRISKQELNELERSADSTTTLVSGFGTYDAVVWTNGHVFRVTTEALNPESDVLIQQIDDETAIRLMAA